MFISSGGIASAVRFRYLSVVADTGQEIFGNGVKLTIWSCVELGLGIIAASLATLRPLIRRFGPTSWTLSSLGTNQSTQSNSLGTKESTKTDSVSSTVLQDLASGRQAPPPHAFPKMSLDTSKAKRSSTTWLLPATPASTFPEHGDQDEYDSDYHQLPPLPEVHVV